MVGGGELEELLSHWGKDFLVERLEGHLLEKLLGVLAVFADFGEVLLQAGSVVP